MNVIYVIFLQRSSITIMVRTPLDVSVSTVSVQISHGMSHTSHGLSTRYVVSHVIRMPIGAPPFLPPVGYHMGYHIHHMD